MRVRAVKRFCAVAFTVCAALVTGHPVMAEEVGVYESLSTITIGRVFLSPDQRAGLDQWRRSMPEPIQDEVSHTDLTRKTRKNQAGYFTSSSGKSRVWSKSGFFTEQGLSKMRFPGDVEITRNVAGERSPESSGAVDATDPTMSDHADSEAADDAS